MVPYTLALLALLPAEAFSSSLASASGLRGKTALRNGVKNDGWGDDPQPACSCDCCDVVRRLPGEIAFGAGVKCAPSTQHNADMCGMQCSPEKDTDGQVKGVLKDEIVDSERFCFFECKPAAGPKAPPTSQCVGFSEQESARTVDRAGNPMDPAFLYAMAPPLSSNRPFLNLNSKSSRVASGVAPDSVDPKKAKVAALKGRASSDKEGADARLEAARLRQMEHVKQKELHAALKAAGNGVVTMDPFAAIQDLNAAAIHARISAEKAAVIASKAVKAYDNGRQKIWKLALSEAGKEVLRWKAFAENKAKTEYEARFKETWQTKAIKKAQEASAPYISGMLRSEESVKLYNGKGFATASAAAALWKESQVEAANANKLPRTNTAQMNTAQANMLDAREKAKQAQGMTLEARQYFATAAEVRKGIPVYQYNAQKAAALAVSAMGGPPGR